MPPRTRNATTSSGTRPHDPWSDPVSTPYKKIVAQHKTTMRDVEMGGEHEHSIHRPIDSILNYQALTQSQTMAETGRYLTIGPQGPLFAHGRPSPISAAGSSTIAENVKLTPRPRPQTAAQDDDPDSSSSDEPSIPEQNEEQYEDNINGYETHGNESNSDDEEEDESDAEDNGGNEEDDEQNEEVEVEEDDEDDDEDITESEGASSNPSAPISQPPSSTRFVDFNIYVNIVDNPTPGVLVCVVEVKPFPFDKIIKRIHPVEAIYQAMEEMLPQVIQQVQYAFHQFCGIKEMHALLFVSAYCRFLRYKRGKVPELPPLGEIPEDGFHFEEDQCRKDIKKIAEPGTRDHLFRLFKGDDYDPAFKKGIDRIVQFATNISLPQPQQ